MSAISSDTIKKYLPIALGIILVLVLSVWYFGRTPQSIGVPDTKPPLSQPANTATGAWKTWCDRYSGPEKDKCDKQVEADNVQTQTMSGIIGSGDVNRCNRFLDKNKAFCRDMVHFEIAMKSKAPSDCDAIENTETRSICKERSVQETVPKVESATPNK